MADDAFLSLVVEHDRTQFAFYGWKRRGGGTGGPYYKLAHSLREALVDLETNDGVDATGGGYLVRDAFLKEGSVPGDAVVHVELIAVADVVRSLEVEGD